MRARQRDIGRDVGDERGALDHWLEQEQAPPPDDRLLAGPDPDPGRLPGGWWILPAMALAIPAWALIFRLILG